MVRKPAPATTFWMEDWVLRGDNTDVVGVRTAGDLLLGTPPTGARILLLGPEGRPGWALGSS